MVIIIKNMLIYKNVSNTCKYYQCRIYVLRGWGANNIMRLPKKIFFQDSLVSYIIFPTCKKCKAPKILEILKLQWNAPFVNLALNITQIRLNPNTDYLKNDQ